MSKRAPLAVPKRRTETISVKSLYFCGESGYNKRKYRRLQRTRP